jgi:hypothetical protein
MIKLGEVRNILESNVKINEFLFTLHERKPVLRFLIEESKIEEVKSLMEKAKLHSEVSTLKLNIEEDPALGYSNKGIVAKEGNILMLYAGKDEIETKTAKFHEEHYNHYSFGLVLGYPSCCSEFFTEHIRNQSKKNNDYVLPMIQATNHNNLTAEPYNWKLNVFVRYGDFNILSHFPCSLKCNSSIELADSFLAVIEHCRPTYAKKLQNILKTGVIYTETEGVFILYDTVINGNKVSFDHLSSTVNNNELFKLLNDEKEFTISGEKSITIKTEREAYFLMFK